VASSNIVVKEGTGTTVLSASNTYTGTTTGSAGTLRFNGTNTGGGLISVAADATLGGTGSTTAPINVTGVFSPGASIESLASGALTMNSGSAFVYEATDNTATGANLMVVNGALSLTGVTLDLSAANLGLFPELL
jgi:fibronectin-binding autotransporter adhesin